MSHIIIPREYPARAAAQPSSWRHAMRQWMTLAEHDPRHGVDPVREQRRRELLATGPVALSPIARAEGPLRVGHVVVDKGRRLWRFRACLLDTRRCVYEKYVEAETLEHARDVGARWMTKEWRTVVAACGGRAPDALVGSATAV